MQDSRCSSKAHVTDRPSMTAKGARGWMGALLLWAALATGCSTVRPAEREHLSQPSMTFGADMAKAHEEHVLANREAAFGGGDARGGGCGCN